MKTIKTSSTIKSTSTKTTSICKSKSEYISLIYPKATAAGPTLPTTTPEVTTMATTAVIAGITVKSSVNTSVRTSVLAISTAPRDFFGNYQNYPMTIDLNGNHQKINLALKSGVTVFWSCSVIHKDTMYVYGGHKHHKGNSYQIAKARISQNSV